MNFYRDKKVLVTGATGLIGSAFVPQLLERGARLRVIEHVRTLPFSGSVEVMQGDLMEPDFARSACRDVDMVVHAAGVSGGSKQVTIDPIPMFSYSLMMNTLIMDAAREAGVRQFLFISNSSVYARSEAVLKENDAWGETCRGVPENETGLVKRIGEAQCALYARYADMGIAIMRTANAYGPHDNFDLEASHVIPALIRKAVEGQTPYRVWGDGSTVRDFIHTNDIAAAGLTLLAEHTVARPVNVATGQCFTIAQVVHMIFDILGLDTADIVFEAEAPPASPAKRLDITRMHSLGIQPRIGLEEGLRQTIEWYRRAHERAGS